MCVLRDYRVFSEEALPSTDSVRRPIMLCSLPEASRLVFSPDCTTKIKMSHGGRLDLSYE